MAKISLKCEQCGGNIILDDSHEFGTCEYCYAQFAIKKDEIIYKVTQNITKHVYGYKGKNRMRDRSGSFFVCAPWARSNG